jgi:hypothetical protein
MNKDSKFHQHFMSRFSVRKSNSQHRFYHIWRKVIVRKVADEMLVKLTIAVLHIIPHKGER